MPYTYHTDEDRAAMLEALGLESEEQLFDQIPDNLYMTGLLPFELGLSEPETIRKFEELAARNRPAGAQVSFLGGGVYDHVVPAVVRNLSSRPEFATAYTPYQPEVSQGTLQVIFEFQTHISRLTGMPVANASMYDAASALAEASLMSVKVTRRDTIVCPANLNPRYRRVIDRYVAGQGIEVREVPVSGDGDIDAAALDEAVTDDVAAVLVQTPNYFGALERPWDYEAMVHDRGALLVVAVDPISLALFRPPGDYNADIVVGEGQSLGNDMSFGGPLVGFMACRDKLIRQMPGRIVSRTKDVDGKDAFVLTLQTREQHIRREKATSNICTNQGLLATRAAIFLSLVGERGFTELGRICYERAHQLAELAGRIDGYSVRYAAPFFREFVLSCPTDAQQVFESTRRSGVLAGIPLSRYFGESAQNDLLVAVTERHTTEDFEKLCRALEDARVTAAR